HQSDDVGLGYGLAFPDGKRVIVVGLGAVGVGDKLVAWNPGHRCQDSLIPDATLQELRVDHLTTALREVQIEDGGKGFQGSVSSFRFRVSSVLPLDVGCDSQDLSLHTMLSDRVATDRPFPGGFERNRLFTTFGRRHSWDVRWWNN